VIAAPVPELGPALPRRFGPWTRALGATALGIAGWRFEGAPPDVARMVVVVAPHTSNWDFPIGVAAMLALGLRVRWLGKHSLFRGPIGAMLRWLGGIPVRRGERLGAVDDAVDAFRAHNRLLIALAPEGTRRRVDDWKTGYYTIAERAGVPVLPVWLDWSRRVVGFGPAVAATGGAEVLSRRLRDRHYRPEMARRPDGYWTPETGARTNERSPR
jgi:1-acyl-sn-glycerol-3-phosphate acyltransferase